MLISICFGFMMFIASLIEQISGAGVGRTRSTWCFWYRPISPRPNPANKISLRFFEIARVLVHLNHVARIVVNANYSIV
jgi:hypothetical protein